MAAVRSIELTTDADLVEDIDGDPVSGSIGADIEGREADVDKV